jgi:hypothetical protein
MKPKAKKNSRPGTSESNKQLLPKGLGSVGFDEPTVSSDTNHSLIYNHYQYSLNSLNVILDRVSVMFLSFSINLTKINLG